jgi:hypothetical protein
MPKLWLRTISGFRKGHARLGLACEPWWDVVESQVSFACRLKKPPSHTTTSGIGIEPSRGASIPPFSPPLTMALATKTQSLKIFEKLKTKPANKVWRMRRVNYICIDNLVDMFRLRSEESNMELCSFRHIPMLRLLCRPSKPRCTHILCSIDQSGLYAPRANLILVRD